MSTNTKAIDVLIAGADRHRKADEFIAGDYDGWDGERPGACDIGCAAKDLIHAGLMPSSASVGDYRAISDATGIPVELLQLEDSIFEGLPESDRPAWPGRFARAAKDRDLDLAWPRFAHWLLSADDSPMRDGARNPGVSEAVRRVASLFAEWIDGRRPAESAWSAARSAARFAGSAARSAAWFAAWFAAWSAAGPAGFAGSAAGSAARFAAGSAARFAARSAAWSAAGSDAGSDARSAAYQEVSQKLVEIMESSPTGGAS